MDFSQVVYDRLSDETFENDGEALFERISSYGRSFITVKVQAVDNEGNSVSSASSACLPRAPAGLRRRPWASARLG